MFASTRHDENAVMHAPLTAKAGAKTPAPAKLNPKTPFQLRGLDENAGTIKHKTGVKNLKQQFVTPVGPSNRTALGQKTTNFKTQNPVPQTWNSSGAGAKRGSPRRRLAPTAKTLPKSIVHDENAEVPEIEYCPPRDKDIPYTDDLCAPDVSILKKNLMSNSNRYFTAGIDINGKSRVQRKIEENERQIELELKAETEALIAEIEGRTIRISRPKLEPKPALDRRPSTRMQPTEGSLQRTRPMSRPLSRVGASTVDARRAAESLLGAGRTASSRAMAKKVEAETSSHGIKRPSSRPVSSHGRTAAPADSTISRQRSRSLVRGQVAAKNTIGYNAGRKMIKTAETKARPMKETSLEAVERLLMEDEEAPDLFASIRNQEPMVLEEDEEKLVDDAIMDGSILFDDEETEEFFIPMQDGL